MIPPGSVAFAAQKHRLEGSAQPLIINSYLRNLQLLKWLGNMRVIHQVVETFQDYNPHSSLPLIGSHSDSIGIP